MTDLNDAETWLYQLGDVDQARAEEIGATNADLVVTEWASYAAEEAPYSPDLIDTMRGEDDALVVSYLSIGEAEPYRYYWDESWETEAGRPDWIGEANPEWTDNIRVEYWDPDWQEIIFDYAEQIVEQGFDGLYLDIVSAYEFWEEEAPDAGIDYRAEMAAFVAEIDAVIDAKVAEVDPGREVVIIGQNGLELLWEDTYLNAIDGVAKEDLRFTYPYGNPEDFDPWPRSEYTYHLDLLTLAEEEGKPTFVVEYVPEDQLAGAEDKLAREAQDLGANGTPIYVATDRDLTSIALQPTAIENGVFDPLGTPGDQVVPFLEGTKAMDTLTGGAVDEVLSGLAGDDVIRAGKGADTAYGDAGNDEVFGGAGGDVLFGNGGLDELFGQKGDDFASGDQKADLIKGGKGDDTLQGGDGHDEIFGQDGFDLIVGGAGGDLLSGGAGADRFVFEPGSGHDEITDFNVKKDVMEIASDYTVGASQGDLLIDLASGGSILLTGVTLAQFDAGRVGIAGDGQLLEM